MYSFDVNAERLHIERFSIKRKSFEVELVTKSIFVRLQCCQGRCVSAVGSIMIGQNTDLQKEAWGFELKYRSSLHQLEVQ